MHQTLRHHQPQPRAFHFRVSGVEALERHEESLLIFRGNAGSGVLDGDGEAIFGS
jgi:hypothetical protein